MATLTVGQIDRSSGATYSLVSAAAGGDVFANNGKTFLVARNANGAATRTVTFAITQLVDGVTPAGKAVTIAASTTKVLGPFPTGIYNNTSGQVAVTYSDSAADITVQAFTL